LEVKLLKLAYSVNLGYNDVLFCFVGVSRSVFTDW